MSLGTISLSTASTVDYLSYTGVGVSAPETVNEQECPRIPVMKKTILSSAILLTLGTASSASALNVSVTSMDFEGSLSVAAGGTLTDNGTFGSIFSIDPFKGIPWTADAVAYFGATGSSLTWAGTSVQGTYNYTFTLSAGQVAWGTLFNWNNNNDIPVLNIMDCGAGNAGDFCTGIGTPMQAGPFPGQVLTFNGIVSAIPVPASLWLFGSGLVGLVGVSRR